MRESVREFLNKTKEKGYLTGDETPKAKANREACRRYRESLDQPPKSSTLYNEILRSIEHSNNILKRKDVVRETGVLSQYRQRELKKKFFSLGIGESDPFADAS